MMMPGRKYTQLSSGYRYGFNGKENDNDIKGDGNQYDYGFRIYDPRVGRFLSTDPLFKGYPWNSPYSYAEGDVIRSVDLDGLEKLIVTNTKDKYGRPKSMVITGLRDIQTKQAVDVNLKDVPDRDVLIITKQQGKRDIKSYDNLNKNYEKQIQKAPVEEGSNIDNSIKIPDGANGAIAKDAFFNGQRLIGEASYDDGKVEAFRSVTNYHLDNPIEKTYTFDNLQLSNLENKENRDIFVQSSIDEYNLSKDKFGKSYNLKTTLIDQVVITAGKADFKGAQLAATDIAKRLGVRVLVKIDDNVKNSSGPSSNPAHVDVKFSGVRY